MARLNEAASAPTETIESLKRKFMRQNRDIARANSAQSLRIRNLENETSRLLAENLGLREQIIQLQNELESGTSQRIADNTGVIKSQLEAKLHEIGALITSLGGSSTPKKTSTRERKATRASPSNSHDQRNWRNMCTLSEAVAGQEGRLPPIMENKSYPRRTLERQDLVTMGIEAAADTTESPDVGPPPVSQFVNEDPVKINLPTRSKNIETEELPTLDPTVHVSIEQRRKRRDSSTSSESRRLSRADQVQLSTETTPSLKVGAKRKLSVREDEEQAMIAKPAEAFVDDFQFTRVANEERSKVTPQPERSASKVARDLAVARGAPKEKQSNTSAPSSRKALAPKNVNDSPKKSSKFQAYNDSKKAKGDTRGGVDKDRYCDKRQDAVMIVSTQADLPLAEVRPEPETPVGLDLLSPPVSQPSTVRIESRDTPPPSDLGPGTEGQRPSRRTRPAVSYAEPSLRDKMRRPTKDFVDAVVSGAGSIRGSIKQEHDDLTLVGIKSEPDANESWKLMPVALSATVEHSPLSGKLALPGALGSATHRKRRESTMPENDLPPLSSEKRRVKADSHEEKLELEGANSGASSTPDIYDFKDSSPAPAIEPSEIPIEAEKQEKQVSRFSRRHSSIAREMPSLYDSESSDPEGSKKSELSKTRRRQSALGLRGSATATRESSRDDRAERALRKASSTIGLSESESATTRSDRLSARRRSMML